MIALAGQGAKQIKQGDEKAGRPGCWKARRLECREA